MDDIEELGSVASSVENFNRSRNDHDGAVLRKALNREADCSSDCRSSYIGNSGRVFVKTWGCSHNSSDSEYMKGLLYEAGYDIVDSFEEAEICVLNSCTVKDPSESVFVNSIRQAERNGVKLVLAGCVPQADAKNKIFQGHSIIGVKQIHRIVEVVSRTIEGNSVRLLDNPLKSPGSRLHLPKIRRNRYIEIIPINTGCLNHCTYCKTKHSRGQLSSYPIAEIIERIHTVANEGVREIWLTSEDLGAYGHDIGTSLAEMLTLVLDQLPDHLYIRLGMTNPPHILSEMGHIAKLLLHERVFSFLHIPVQSGSSRILEKMARDYTREDFEVLVDYLKVIVPDIHLATDVICGFPTETDLEFQETLSLIDKYRFASVHISQFYARRGTAAALMPRIPSHIIKDRSRAMTNLFHSYRSHDHKLGRMYNVLCTELASDGTHLVAHNKSYDQILVSGKPDQLLGKCFTVVIRSCDKFHMIGDLIPGTICDNLPLSSIASSSSSSSSPSLSSSCDNDIKGNVQESSLIQRSCNYWPSHDQYRLGIALILLIVAIAIRSLRHLLQFY